MVFNISADNNNNNTNQWRNEGGAEGRNDAPGGTSPKGGIFGLKTNYFELAIFIK